MTEPEITAEQDEADATLINLADDVADSVEEVIAEAQTHVDPADQGELAALALAIASARLIIDAVEAGQPVTEARAGFLRLLDITLETQLVEDEVADAIADAEIARARGEKPH